jgi:hypothetical protein
MQSRLVQFVDHEADDLLFEFRDHADAIPLTEAANEIFLRPRELETLAFDVQHLGHIASNHPPDVNTNILFPLRAHIPTPP